MGLFEPVGKTLPNYYYYQRSCRKDTITAAVGKTLSEQLQERRYQRSSVVHLPALVVLGQALVVLLVVLG